MYLSEGNVYKISSCSDEEFDSPGCILADTTIVGRSCFTSCSLRSHAITIKSQLLLIDNLPSLNSHRLAVISDTPKPLLAISIAGNKIESREKFPNLYQFLCLLWKQKVKPIFWLTFNKPKGTLIDDLFYYEGKNNLFCAI